MDDDRRSAFLLGALVGVVLGAAVVAGAGAWLLPADGRSSPSYSMAAATGCGTDPVEGGWVGQVQSDEGAVVVFNYTVPHATPGADVRGELSEPTNGTYVFAISVREVTDDGRDDPPEGCQPRTTIDASVALPADFETLEIALDGRAVATVEAGDGHPSFRTVNGSAVG